MVSRLTQERYRRWRLDDYHKKTQSPHLKIYKSKITSVFSIFKRIMGIFFMFNFFIALVAIIFYLPLDINALVYDGKGAYLMENVSNSINYIEFYWNSWFDVDGVIISKPLDWFKFKIILWLVKLGFGIFYLLNWALGFFPLFSNFIITSYISAVGLSLGFYICGIVLYNNIKVRFLFVEDYKYYFMYYIFTSLFLGELIMYLILE